MKKVVLLSDGKNFSKGTFEIVKSLHQKEPFLLTGAFFHSINYERLVSTTFARVAEPYVNYLQEEHTTYAKEVVKFKTLCERNNIEYTVHKEGEEWNVDELVKESRFTDLMAVSGQLFFSDFFHPEPNRFLRDVLSCAECPVLVIPENITNVERIAIAYDGSKESMFAIKSFCHVLPALTNLPVDIYYWVKHTDDDIPDFDYMQEFSARHFPNLNFRERFFDPGNYLADWLANCKNTLLVCGSYHRSKISSLFKKSFAEDVIRKHSAAVFIAHSL